MKTVILCEVPHHHSTVYAPVVTNRLKALTDCDCARYGKADGKNITFTPSKNADINPYIKIGPNSTQQS